MAWTTPRTWIAGEVVTSANLNTYISNDLAYLKSVIDGTASVAVLSTQPCAHAYMSGNQTLTSAVEATLAFDREYYDTDTIHDLVTNNSRLTCKTAGKYRVTANLRFASNGTGYRYVYVRLNGTGLWGLASANAVSGTVTALTCAVTISLAVNDYLEVRAFQNSGGNLDAEALEGSNVASTEFMMEYVSN